MGDRRGATRLWTDYGHTCAFTPALTKRVKPSTLWRTNSTDRVEAPHRLPQCPAHARRVRCGNDTTMVTVGAPEVPQAQGCRPRRLR